MSEVGLAATAEQAIGAVAGIPIGVAAPTATSSTAKTTGSNSAATASSGKPASSLVDKDGLVKILMRVAPDQVEGTASLWRIATQAVELKVHEAAVALLIQIHTSLEESLMPRLAEFEDIYMNSCVDVMQANLNCIRSRTEEQKKLAAKAILEADRIIYRPHEKRLSRAMRCLKKLVQNSEIEGTFGIIALKSLSK